MSWKTHLKDHLNCTNLNVTSAIGLRLQIQEGIMNYIPARNWIVGIIQCEQNKTMVII